MFSKELKKWIYDNVQGIYSGEIYSDIDLFEKSLCLKAPEKNLEGINEILPQVLEEMAVAPSISVLQEKMERFVKIEPFLRHLFGILEPERFSGKPKDEPNGLNMNEWTLAPLLKQAFNIVPMSYDLSQHSPASAYFSYKNAYDTVYDHRNSAAHSFLSLSSREIWEIISACLIVYLDVSGRLCMQIEEAFSKESVKVGFSSLDYCREIVRTHNQTIKNGFSYVDIKWRANANSVAEYSTVETMLNDSKNTVVKILGEAGCGKTTIMRQLEYLCAKKYIAQKTNVIPVFISLGSIETNSAIQLDIKSIICHKLNITQDLLSDMLQTNSINLYLDGFNEILESKAKKQVAWSIDDLSRKYPKTVIFLSDRALVRPAINVLDTALTYRLYPLDSAMKETFIKSNCPDEETKSMLLRYFTGNPNNYERFTTPIKLKQLIEITASKKSIPEDFDGEYIKYIFERELVDKKDENVQYLEDFACALAIFSDSEIPFKVACACLAKCKNVLGYTVPDSLQCLNLLVEIGILSNEEGMIEFKYPSYHNYFWTMAFENHLDTLLGDDL